MRKIEKNMLHAIEARKFAYLGNTCVEYVTAGNPHGPRSEVFLHGNHIADFWHDTKTLDVDTRTLAMWPTVTTKSRLRALGANVYTKKHVTYLNDEPVV
jgi:hypothetical protein